MAMEKQLFASLKSFKIILLRLNTHGGDMKILILGCEGFIGSHLYRRGNDLNLDVYGISRKDCNFLETQKLSEIIKHHNPGWVINAAGEVAGIQGNREKPYDLLNHNAQLALSISASSLAAGVKNYISFSAACVYPSQSKEEISTLDLWTGKPEITSLSYATSKILGMQLNESINIQFGLEWRTIIPSNLFGVKPNFGQIDNASHVLESLIAKMCAARRNNLKSVEVWGDGTPMRTFLHVEDLVSATFHVMQEARNLSNVINVNGSQEISIGDLARSIARYADFDGKLIFNKDMPNGALRKNLDDSEIRESGWSPKIDFYTELESLVVRAAQ
jgi:GDP-L-fucose synthase